MRILPPINIQSITENRGEGTSQYSLLGQYYPDSKTRQTQYKKGKLQANIPHEYKHKNHQHISKYNSAIHKKNCTPRPRFIPEMQGWLNI